MPLIAAFAPWMVALFLLLVSLAAWVVAELLARVLGEAPFIGGWIASHVRSAAGYLIAVMIRQFDGATADVGHTFAAMAAWAWRHMFATSEAMFHAVASAVHGIYLGERALATIGPTVAHGVAWGVGTAEHYAAGVAYGAMLEAERVAASGVAAAEHAAGVVAHDLAVNTYNLAHNLAAEASLFGADIAGVAARVAAIEHALTGDVTGLVSQIKSDLAAAIATAEGAAAAAQAAATAAAHTIASDITATAVADLDAAAHDLVMGPWEALIAALAPVAAGLPAVAAQALGLPGVIAQSLPVSIPGILSMVVPAVAAVATEVDNCLVPNCSPLNSLGSLINGLEDLGLAATLAALVAEAVADPAGAARAVEDAGGWMNGYVTELADAVLG